MTYGFKLLLLLVLAIFLFNDGGEGDKSQFYFGIFLCLFLIYLAIQIPSSMRIPKIDWIFILLFPFIFISILQVIPFCIPHPWVKEDVATIFPSVKNICYSISPEATFYDINWGFILLGFTLILSVLFRGDRIRILIDGIIGLSSFHAFVGIIALICGLDWPGEESIPFTRSSFVYINHAAAFWSGCLPLAILSAKITKNWWNWAMVGVLWLSILLSGSRGGIIISSLVSVPLIISILPRKNRLLSSIGLFIIIGAWLSVIGLQDVRSRFETLGKTGITLDGRLTIWKSALPIILEAGPMGSGGGTTMMAYHRNEDSTFIPKIVDHLHSDPLEWCLEFGWIGLSLGILGIILTIYHLRLRDHGNPSDELIILRRGSLLGVLILCLHSCFDFIFHSPAIDLLAMSLLVTISQCRKGNEQIEISSSFGIRIMFTIISIAIAIELPSIFFIEKSNSLARMVGSLIYHRMSHGLSVGNDDLIKAALETKPDSISLAVMQSWISRNIPEVSGNRKNGRDSTWFALDQASNLVPGDARAWTERAALFCDLGEYSQAIGAARRSLAWAPASPDIQLSILSLAKNDFYRTRFPRRDIISIIDKILSIDNDQPNWFFDVSSKIIGSDELSKKILSSGLRLKRSSLSWMSTFGGLSEWIRIMRDLADQPLVIHPELLAMKMSLFGDVPFRVLLPSTSKQHRDISEKLQNADLPIPGDLTDVLRHDGLPWSLWSEPINIIDNNTRIMAENILRGEQYQHWASNCTDRLVNVDRILSGDWDSLNRNTDPEFLDYLSHPHKSIEIPIKVCKRCELLLARYNEIEWESITDHLKFSWLYVDGHQLHTKETCQVWTGIVIDGRWIGWTRGKTDFLPLLRAGLHRIALLIP